MSGAAHSIGREFLKVAAVLAFVLACAGRAPAQIDADGRWQNGVTESWWLDPETFPTEDKLNAATLWKSIGEANAQDAGDARAGDYFEGGDTSGAYMRWSPRAGFVIAYVNKCEARVRTLIYGRVEAAPTLVQFFPDVYRTQPRKREGEQQQQAGTPPAVLRYVPVEWRGRRLLVEEGEMEDFGDYLAGLGNYNGRNDFIFTDLTSFFTRVEASAETEDTGAADSGEPGPVADDSGVGVSGEHASYAPPVVPPGYERFLKKPVEATVKAVGRRSVKRDYLVELPYNSFQYNRGSFTRVTISAGTAQGVKDRTVFRVVEPDEGDTVIVLRAGENESEAVVVRELDERGAETFYVNGKDIEKKHSKVSSGWKLTTKPF